MSHKQPNWMQQEQNRAEDLKETGNTSNPKAPQLIKVVREPSRKQKNFYIQDSYAEAFEDLVFKQKKAKGKKAPALAEQALMLLFEFYNEDTSNL